MSKKGSITMNWYFKVLKNYINFSGRARRREFWMFTLISFIITSVINLIEYPLNTEILSIVYEIGIFLPSFAVAVRRLHDVGKSGWWLVLPNFIFLLAYIFILNGNFTSGLISTVSFVFVLVYGIILLVWLCRESDAGRNKYGKNPKESV